MDGWIKLHRKLLDNPVFQNEKLLKMFVWCLLKAAHEGYSQLVGLQIIEVGKGQFVYGRNKASIELKMKPSSVHKLLKKLQELKIIDVKSNNKFSLVTIINWELYQSKEKKVTAEEQQRNNNVTTKEQQSNTNKKVKNLKNDKNVKNDKKSTCVFEEFWNAYPKKKSKGNAEKSWDKIEPSQELVEQIINSITQAKLTNDWIKNNGQFIPYPATWLNQKGWLDEYKVNRTVKTQNKPLTTAQMLIEKIKKMEDENGQNTNNEIITDVEYTVSKFQD